MADFTESELHVLKLIAKGLYDKNIAEEMEVPISKIQKCKKTIYEKLEAKNRIQAAVKAIESGYIKV